MAQTAVQQQSTTASKPYVNRWNLAFLAVIMVSAFAYAGTGTLNGLKIWDDNSLIGGQKSLLACFTEPFLRHYFRPLVSVSFYLDNKIWGSGTFFCHQTNILIHVLTTAALIAALVAAFKSPRVALVGGLLFAVQPAQISTTAWVGGRTDSLCALWIALFALTLIRAARESGRRRVLWLMGAAVSYGAALLTKEQSLLAVALVPLAFHCFTPDKQPNTRGAGWRATVPFVLVAMLFIATWVTLWPDPVPAAIHSVPTQLCLAGRTLTYYTLLLLTPTPRWIHCLTVDGLARAGMITVVSGYAILALVSVLFVRWVRAALPAAWFLALALLTILPISNLVPVPSLVVAPFRAGVAGLGIAALLGWVLGRSLPMTAALDTRARNARRLLRANWRLVPATLLIAWCTGLTLWGTTRWSDEKTLFSTILRYDPTSIVAQYNLSGSLYKLNETRPATRLMETSLQQLFGSSVWKTDAALRAIQTDPSILNRVRECQGNAIAPTTWLAALYGQLGFGRLRLDDKQGALRAFRTGSQIDRTSDECSLGLGVCAFQSQRLNEAADYLRISIASSPLRPECHMIYGQVLAAQGRWPAAREEYQQWANLVPWSGLAYDALATADTKLGDYAAARTTLEYALHHSICDPTHVRKRLAELPGRSGQIL